MKDIIIIQTDCENEYAKYLEKINLSSDAELFHIGNQSISTLELLKTLYIRVRSRRILRPFFWMIGPVERFLWKRFI